MEIDRHNLPSDPAALQRMVVGLLEELDSKNRRLRQMQHWLEQLLRQRHGQRSKRLEYVPASLQVIEEACQKYACPKGCTVVTVAKPAAPIERGLPGPGLLAQVAVSKYADHLPLHRQESIFARQGVELSRQTMCDWMRQSAELVSLLHEVEREARQKSLNGA